MAVLFATGSSAMYTRRGCPPTTVLIFVLQSGVLIDDGSCLGIFKYSTYITMPIWTSMRLVKFAMRIQMLLSDVRLKKNPSSRLSQQ